MKRIIPLFTTLIICLLYSSFSFSKVKSDTFNVTIKGKLVTVISPLAFSKKLSVIVVNESLTKVVLKIMKDTGKSLGFMILESKAFSSLDLVFDDKSVEYYLIPFSPAAQKIILKIGRESYDIPFKQ
jgi:hypothetical protein